MKPHEFFHKYANTPLSERDFLITHDRYGSNIEPVTLSEIYQRISAIEDKIRPDHIELEKLLGIAEDYWEPPEG